MQSIYEKQKHINHGLQIIDEDFESDDEEEIRENWVYQQPEDEEENQPLHRQRRLGLDMDMIGAREENLGSTRSQTLEMRSPSNQTIEKANIHKDNWIQETCYISVVTSGPDEPSNSKEASNHLCLNERRKWREAITKNYTVWKTKKSGRTDTIYIKPQVFRLLRYYSPAPMNIARSDWATQNITHNMTSPIT